MPTDLPALIARLEAADAGSRDLDTEIGRTLGWRYRHVDGYLHRIAGDRWDGPSGVTLGDLPRWSTSLDDALAHVVPEGWGWIVADDGSAQLLEPDETGGRGLSDAKGKAATPALALCIASLRALQAMSEGG